MKKTVRRLSPTDGQMRLFEILSDCLVVHTNRKRNPILVGEKAAIFFFKKYLSKTYVKELFHSDQKRRKIMPLDVLIELSILATKEIAKQTRREIGLNDYKNIENIITEYISVLVFSLGHRDHLDSLKSTKKKRGLVINETYDPDFQGFLNHWSHHD